MKFKLILVALIFNSICYSQLPSVVAGSIQRIDSFSSKYISPRNIDIWLPAGFNKNTKYPVLYMHDGQMLFDSTHTWNKTSWDIDDAITQLVAEHKMPNIIVVGIWSNGISRHADYFPQQPYESLSKEEKERINSAVKTSGLSFFKKENYVQSDRYLKFIVKELKPFIDSAYPTLKDYKNTIIGGSSMGGLISMYAICEYPEVFGGAICMSTHWPGIFSMQDNPIPNAFNQYLENKLPSPSNHKLYFDYGTKTLDSLYEPLQKRIDQTIKQKGYTNTQWETRKFEGDEHSELAWRKRVNIPLSFMYKKK